MGNHTQGRNRLDFVASRHPLASGNTALAQLPFSGQSTAGRLRAARFRAIPFSRQLRGCQGFDMSSRANSSDISLSTVSCVRTDCIDRVLKALKQIA